MKRALITGGSGAIGAAVCRALAKDGLHVVVHANSRVDTAQALAEEIRGAGGSAEAVCFDVADAAATEAALEKLLLAGPIQVLVNNAGIHRDGILAGMSQEQWHSVVDVSLHGFFNVTQPLLLPMLRTRWGRIVNMSSVSGVMGNRGQANYAAAKAGLIGATKSLAQEVAARNVTVNAVAPGIILEPDDRGRLPRGNHRQSGPHEARRTPGRGRGLGQLPASDKASYISGQVISINGAMA